MFSEKSNASRSPEVAHEHNLHSATKLKQYMVAISMTLWSKEREATRYFCANHNRFLRKTSDDGTCDAQTASYECDSAHKGNTARARTR